MTPHERLMLYSRKLIKSATNLQTNDSIPAIAKLEAFARTLCGLAPRNDYKYVIDIDKYVIDIERTDLLNAGIDNIYVSWYAKPGIVLPKQALVEAAYLALAFIRNPKLWYVCPGNVQYLLTVFFNDAIRITPLYNNWVLFPAIIQLFKNKVLDEKDWNVIYYAIMTLENWYKGDSLYGDGEQLQVDYYNSYVIYPMLTEMYLAYPEMGLDVYIKRAQRYAVILENLISPEGTFPVMGRSSTYRFGAFAHLSDMLRRRMLPEELDAAATCNALFAVIDRMMSAPNNFENNILQIGVVGKQPSVAEWYISAGSPYLCCMGLSHLEIDSDDVEWQHPDNNWTQKNIWQGHSNLVISKSIHL